MFYIGIDISKKTIDSAHRTGTMDQAKYIDQFENNLDGFNQLTRQISHLNADHQGIFMTLEPTGGYEQNLLHYGIAQGWQVSLPNPKQIKDFGKGQGKRGKTDRIDSRTICDFGAERKPPCTTLLPENVEAMNDLLQRKEDIEQFIRAEKNRQKQYIQRPRQTKRVSSSLTKILEALEEELDEIEKEIKEVVKNDLSIASQIKHLLTLPGVGPRIVHILFVHLMKCFVLTQGNGTANMVVAMAGLDPEPYKSGTSVYKPPRISKKGNALVRKKLYMGALGGVTGKNLLKDFYLRLKGRGKAGKVALVAAARKILIWAWAIFVKEVDFDPAFAGQKS